MRGSHAPGWPESRPDGDDTRQAAEVNGLPATATATPGPPWPSSRPYRMIIRLSRDDDLRGWVSALIALGGGGGLWMPVHGLRGPGGALGSRGVPMAPRRTPRVTAPAIPRRPQMPRASIFVAENQGAGRTDARRVKTDERDQKGSNAPLRGPGRSRPNRASLRPLLGGWAHVTWPAVEGLPRRSFGLGGHLPAQPRRKAG